MGDENLSDKVGSCKDEIVEELRNCLPKWVTLEQVTDMIRGTLVEIVDDFYEHETIFYEQVPSDVTSRDGFGSGNHEALVSKLELLHCETERDEKSQSSQFHKLKSMTSSQKSSLSPVKRNRKTKAKPNKKGKDFAKFESKQASITKFFNKVPSDDTTA